MKINEAPPASVMLDVRPLAAPVSPFAWVADQLAAADYQPHEIEQARQAHGWLKHLERAAPGVRSADPIALAAIARSATDGAFRAMLRAGIEAIEREIEALDHPPTP